MSPPHLLPHPHLQLPVFNKLLSQSLLLLPLLRLCGHYPDWLVGFAILDEFGDEFLVVLKSLFAKFEVAFLQVWVEAFEDLALGRCEAASKGGWLGTRVVLRSLDGDGQGDEGQVVERSPWTWDVGGQFWFEDLAY